MDVLNNIFASRRKRDGLAYNIATTIVAVFTDADERFSTDQCLSSLEMQAQGIQAIRITAPISTLGTETWFVTIQVLAPRTTNRRS